MYYDIPNYPCDFTSESKVEKSSQYEIIECASAKNLKSANLIPLAIHHEKYAKKIIQTFGDGFQWEDIGTMILLCYNFMEEFPQLPHEHRKNTVIQILYKVVDLTDGPGPDKFIDIGLKKLIPPFVEMIAPDNLIHLKPVLELHRTPGEREIAAYKAQILRPFKDGFHWQDVATVMYYTLGFVTQFVDMSLEDQKTLSFAIIDDVIDETNGPFWDSVTDPIVKKLYKPLVEQLLKKIKKIELK